MMIKLLNKRGKQNYNIHGGNYKRKSDPNRHTNPIFDASLRLGDATLIMILILGLILPS